MNYKIGEKKRTKIGVVFYDINDLSKKVFLEKGFAPYVTRQYARDDREGMIKFIWVKRKDIPKMKEAMSSLENQAYILYGKTYRDECDAVLNGTLATM